MRSALRLLANVAVSVAVSILGSAAHAGVIYGAWDPDFGGTYTGTGFRGTVKFFVPSACLPIGAPFAGFILDTDACSGGGMYLIQASVTLYDNNNTPNDFTDDTDLNTIVFAPPVQSPDPVVGVYVNWDGSQLLGAALETDLIGPQPSGVGSTVAPSDLYLQFSYLASFDEFDPLPVGAYLIGCNYDGDICYPISSERSNPATDVRYSIPEPASLALLLWGGAMGAGCFLRRRSALS